MSSLARRWLQVLSILAAAGVVPAQRFDNWIAAPVLPNNASSTTQVVTEPLSGTPFVLMAFLNVQDTAVWNGAQFVPLLIPSPGGSSGPGETLAPFVSATASGLVHLDINDVTSIMASGPWTSLGVLTPSPGSRSAAAATNAVDASGRAYVFGGIGLTSFLNDLWAFDGTAWTNLTPATGPLPSPRSDATLTADGLGGLLLHGGFDGSNILGDVWRFDGARWKQLGDAPLKRMGHAAVLDVSRGQLVVAGGANSSGNFFDAWTVPVAGADALQPASWTQITASLPFTASASGRMTGARDPFRNELVLVDAFFNEVVNDQVASVLVRAQGPATNCVVPVLQIQGAPPVQPRVGAATTNVPLGGQVGVAAAPMLLAAEFVVPAIGAPTGTPIPGSGCFSFLSAAAQTIATTNSTATGDYVFTLVIPPNPVLIGQVIDAQAFGLVGAQLAASQAVRIAIGR